MAEEETNEEQQTDDVETPEVPALEAEAEEQAESQADTAETEAEVEEATEATPAEAAAADAPVAAPAAAEPVVLVTPKERRRLRRLAKAPAPRGAMSPQERQAERDERRVANARARRGERAKARTAKPTSEPVAPPAIEHAVGRLKTRQGIVVSDKAAKTISVRVDTSRRHRRYKKIVRSSKVLHAHDENNEAHEGDLVRVVETRPLSATKRWRLTDVLERAR
jgi:small subunit ribosomal protein S17